MKTIILYLLLFCYFTLNSQVNLPLKFQNDIANWTSLTWMQDVGKNNQWFDNAAQPIVIEDTIYLFMNYFHKAPENGINYGYAGFSVKKLHKKTGLLFWETQRFYSEYFHRNIISTAQITNNSIDIALTDEAPTSGSVWNNCYPAYIRMNSQNGVVIDSNFVDKSNTTLPKFITNSDFLGSKFYKTDNGYLRRDLIILFNPNVEFGLKNTYLDETGHITNADTFILNQNYNLQLLYHYNISPNRMNALAVSADNNWNDKEIQFLKFDLGLNLLKSDDITHYFLDTIKTFGLSNISNGYSIISTSYESPTTRILQMNFHLFDAEGNFIEKMTYKLLPDQDTGIIYGWLYPMVDIVNKRILLTHSRQNKLSENTFFEIFAVDRDSVKMVKRIEVEGIKDHFRTQYATMMENGDILLYVQQFASLASDAPMWYSWIMLDGQKMNIVSSNEDIVNTNHKAQLYPNPTSGLINFSQMEAKTSITVYNAQGQVVSLPESTSSQIDLKNLPIGMYVIHLLGNEINESHRIFKVE